jgi:ATP-dependent DNA helicase RecG
MEFAVHDGVHDEKIKRVHDTVQDGGTNSVENSSHKLVWLLDSEMNREELMHLLGLKSRNNFQKTYIKPCVKEGLIEQTLPNKKTSKNQKYKLTKKGKLLQKKLK